MEIYAPLSPRESQFLKDIEEEGLQEKGIARKHGISPGTVKCILRNARFKLGANTTAQAVARAIRWSLICAIAMTSPDHLLPPRLPRTQPIRTAQLRIARRADDCLPQMAA